MAKRKSLKSSGTVARKPASPAVETSYDTKMIITVILLLFFYPLGLILMWAWMRTWPRWVKIIISLPLLIVILFIFVVFYFVGNAIRNAHYNNYEYQRRMERMQDNGNMMYITPTVAPNTY